jgi:hypothetical protein
LGALFDLLEVFVFPAGCERDALGWQGFSSCQGTRGTEIGMMRPALSGIKRPVRVRLAPLILLRLSQVH